jgi:hypothetical protein
MSFRRDCERLPQKIGRPVSYDSNIILHPSSQFSPIQQPHSKQSLHLPSEKEKTMDFTDTHTTAAMRTPLMAVDLEAGAAPEVELPSRASPDVAHEDDEELPFGDPANLACWSEEGDLRLFFQILLLLQFGMAFRIHDETTMYLSWTMVNLSIAAFTATAWLYRQTCADANLQCVVLLVLPEILMDGVLVLVLFKQVLLGYFLLLASILGLGVFSVYHIARSLERARQESRAHQAKSLLI